MTTAFASAPRAERARRGCSRSVPPGHCVPSAQPHLALPSIQPHPAASTDVGMPITNSARDESRGCGRPGLARARPRTKYGSGLATYSTPPCSHSSCPRETASLRMLGSRFGCNAELAKAQRECYLESQYTQRQVQQSRHRKASLAVSPTAFASHGQSRHRNVTEWSVSDLRCRTPFGLMKTCRTQEGEDDESMFRPRIQFDSQLTR